MTDQAHSPRNRDLVGLYAGRMRARYQRPSFETIEHREKKGVQTFGRAPETEERMSPGRRRAVTALVATAVVAGSTPALASGSGGGPTTHEIQKGETLFGISQQYGVGLEDLRRVNDIDDPNLIYAGDSLLIDELMQVEVGDTVYRIKDGDTLFSIAERHDVDVETLAAFNEIDVDETIYPGDSLIIPTRDQLDLENGAIDYIEEPAETEQAEPPAESEDFDPPAENEEIEPPAQNQSVDETPTNDGGQVIPDDQIRSLHLVAEGETMFGIAERYGVSIERLALANGIEDESILAAGTMLRIPTSFAPAPEAEPVEETAEAEQASDSTILEGMPAHQQSLSLSCEAAALSMVTEYWGTPVSEWVFIENMPYDPNPHRGFRGDMTGAYGGTDDYGVYAGPLSSMLSNYGFVGEEFYTYGDTTRLTERIDQGQPVIVWTDAIGSGAQPFPAEHEGESFTLVPGQHVVVAYGYDDSGLHVADPGNGQHHVLGWDQFVESWSKFDGMSMAVYPKS